MAKLIKSSGEVVVVSPTNMEEVQKYVGNDLELYHSCHFFTVKNGKTNKLTVNTQASHKYGILLYGDVLITSKQEWQDLLKKKNSQGKDWNS